MSPRGGAEQPAVSPSWRDARTALALLAVDPKGLGGLTLRRAAAPAREKLLETLRALLPENAPLRRLPPGVADDRLLGSLDLAATLATGRPVHQRGLLCETNGGVLVVPGAERLAPGVAARIASALDRGVVAAERDGFGTLHPARFAVVAFDDAEGDDPPPPAAIAERLGLVVDLHDLRPTDLSAEEPTVDIDGARRRLPLVAIDEDAVHALAKAADALGVTELRPLLSACDAARAAAALGGRDAPDEADLELAARLVFGPRAVCAPACEQSEEQSSPEDRGDGRERNRGDDGGSADDPRELAERVLAAAQATLPPGLVEAGAEARAAGASGRSGALQASPLRGRPIGSRAGRLEAGARLDLVATLRAAAPWQPMRRKEAGANLHLSPARRGRPAGPGEGASPSPENLASPHPPPLTRRRPLPSLSRVFPTSVAKDSEVGNTRLRGERWAAAPLAEKEPGRPKIGSTPAVLVRRDDFRIQRLKERRRSLTIFVVDASGSAALHRLAEAKGAVELLLAESYVRRDEVALIAFRGNAAELVLPPTRSLTRARRSLGALPGGGGTPLASAIDAAALTAVAARRRGDRPSIVFLTDGQANVARDGEAGRARAQEEAEQAARALKTLGLPALVIDVSPRANPRARAMSQAMGARYLPLPAADATALARAASG